MKRWKLVFKRCALALVAATIALTWSQTGQAQAPCLISRGLDPLDVLNSGVRHNVWIVLDTSGSMGDPFGGGQTRIEVARDVLTEIIDEFVDASGKPLVNWGYVGFAKNNPNSGTACNAQFTNSCAGLAMSELIDPPACDAPSSAASIKSSLKATVNSKGNPARGGYTPNGISMDQISGAIVANNYVNNLKTNQKNFIILVTDGDDTCECSTNKDQSGKLVDGIWTPTKVPPFVTGTTVPSKLRGGNVDGEYTKNTGGGADRQAVNAGTKGRLAYERLNPTTADRADGLKGGSFVIGLGLGGNGQSRANHMAWEASGYFYGNPNATPALFANDKAQLKQRLRDAFAKIGIPQSEVALGSPVVGTVREVIPNYTNTYATTADHVGDVGPTNPDPDDVRDARSVRANHRDNVLFSTTVEVPGFKGHLTATNIYQVTDNANPRANRTADFREIWDAGDMLQQRSPDSREIFFNRRGETTLRPFDTANVRPEDLGVKAGFLSEIDDTGAWTDNDARDIVVQVMRGYRLSKHPTTNKIYRPDGKLNFSEFEEDGSTKTWKLYDSLGAPTVVQNPPRSPDYDPPQNHADKYGVGGSKAGDGFYWDHFNRQTMVYLPSNAGLFHAFDGGTGDEVFAIIPDDVMGLDPNEVVGNRDTLRDLVELIVAKNNGIPNHQFLMHGSATVSDTFLRSDFGGNDDWHTMLLVPRGRGGRFVTALDVTDPLQPLMQFNVGNREGISEGLIDGLGETWSLPVPGNVKTIANATSNPDRADQWLAFLGGGYGCNNSNDEGQYIFALRMEDGSVYYRGKVSDDPNAEIPYNALIAAPRLFNPHEKDVADQNDFVTRAYIGDIQGNLWKLVTHDINPNNWSLEKFAELGDKQPIGVPVTLLNDANTKQVYVMVGTGGDLRVSSTVSDFKVVALVDTDPDGANTQQYPLGSTPLWEHTLNAEERVYVPPVTIGEFAPNRPAPVIYFAASRPEFDGILCQGTFHSTLYALGVVSGQAEVDLDGGGPDVSTDLGNDKVTGIYARDGNLYVSEAGGLGSAGSLNVYGDGDFSDGANTGGSGNAPRVQILVDAFRISPF